MTNLCNVDGAILPEADARIPVLDRGFLFGDSIYEVVRTFGDAPFGWPEHWARLEASAAAIRMPLDLDERTVASRVAETLRAADHGDSYVRIVVTRGTGDAPNIDLAYAKAAPRWVVMVRALSPTAGRPLELAVVERLRNDRRALDPATKSGNYLNNVLALAEAKALGAHDCVMLNAAGHVTEASTSNLFVRLDGRWCTPPLTDGILAGVTRGLLLDFLPAHGEPVEQRSMTKQDLLRAEEVFLSSTLRDIAPVSKLDGRPLPGAAEGSSAARLAPLFAAHVAERHRSHDAPRWRQLVGR